MHRIFKNFCLLPAVAACIGIAGASTLTVDFTPNPLTNGVVQLSNGAILVAGDTVGSSVGTGNLDPFLRVQGNTSEQGFNTDAQNGFVCPTFNGTTNCDIKTGQWTHSTTANSFGVVTNPEGFTGTFVRFVLDINQNTGGGDNLLSLDEVKLYNHAGAIACGGSGDSCPTDVTDSSQVGPNIFSLSSATSCTTDVGSHCSTSATGSGINVNLNYDLNKGSGNGYDLFLYVPTSVFTAGTYDANHYLTLYSAFGLPDQSNDGFEEWARVISDASPVPEPKFVLALILAAGLIFMNDLRKRRKTA